MGRWTVWLIILGLAVLAAYQRVELARIQSAERLYAEKIRSVFPYALRRADFDTLPTVMAQLAEEKDLEAKIRLFKRAQTLAVAFTDDLLRLNDLRYPGRPMPQAGVQYGDYIYRPSTPEQEALQWKILRSRLYTTLWAMERKFYLDEGVMQTADREALTTMTGLIESIGGLMLTVREQAGQPFPESIHGAAHRMEGLTPLLEELGRVGTAYEAALPPLQPRPGGLYDRLYGL